MKLSRLVFQDGARGLRMAAVLAGLLLSCAGLFPGLAAPACAAPALGMKYSTADNDLSQEIGVNSWMGAPVLYHVTFTDYSTWSQWDGGPWYTSTIQQWVGQGPNYREVISLGLLPSNDAGDFAGIISGSHDTDFKDFGQALTNAGVVSQVIVRLGWEFNQPAAGASGNWYPWGCGSNTSGYAEAFDRAVQMMRSTAPGLKICWCPNLGGAQNWQACWPTNTSGVAQDGDVDYIGLDAYEGDVWANILSSTPGLSQIRTLAASKGKPECYPEWGLKTSPAGDDPTYVTNMYSFFNTGTTVAFQDYWNNNCCSTLEMYPLNSTTTNSSVAYKSLFGKAGNTNTHSGAWAAQAVLGSSPSYSSIYANDNVSANTNYVATVWVKGSGKLSFSIVNSGWTGDLATTNVTATGSWQQITLPSFNTGTNTQIHFQLYDNIGGTAGTVYIDDGALTLATGGTNLLANAGYESGDTSWSHSGAFSIFGATGNTYTGTWVAEANLASAQEYSSVYQNDNVSASTNYVASVWVKGAGNLSFNIVNSGWTAALASTNVAATGSWQQISLPSFNTGSNTQVHFQLYDSVGGTPGTVFIDDGSLSLASGGSNILSNPGFESGSTSWTLSGIFATVDNP